jgi:hypothetical protein
VSEDRRDILDEFAADAFMVGTACRRFALIRMVNPFGVGAFAAKGMA